MIILLQELVFSFLVALIGDDFWILFGELPSLFLRHVSHLLDVRLLLLSPEKDTTHKLESIQKINKHKQEH